MADALGGIASVHIYTPSKKIKDDLDVTALDRILQGASITYLNALKHRGSPLRNSIVAGAQIVGCRLQGMNCVVIYRA